MSGCRELSTPSLGEYISPDNYSEGGLIVRGPYSPGAHIVRIKAGDHVRLRRKPYA